MTFSLCCGNLAATVSTVLTYSMCLDKGFSQSPPHLTQLCIGFYGVLPKFYKFYLLNLINSYHMLTD